MLDRVCITTISITLGSLIILLLHLPEKTHAPLRSRPHS